MKVTFVYCVFENLGVEYLSAVLKRAGHETDLLFDPRLFDYASKLYSNQLLGRAFNMRRALMKKLIRMKPDVVCFSVVSADYIWALDFAKDIKKTLGVPIIFGGIHPTAVPEQVLENEQVDYVILGEGEGALLDIVNQLSRGEVDPTTPNLWLRVDGKIVGNKPRPLIHDLDALPFADKDLFYKQGPPFDIGHMAMARRGCHGSCTYCCNSLRRKIYFGDSAPNYRTASGFLRRRSVDNMIAELKWAREKYRIGIIRYNDDDFAESEEWLEEYRDKARGDLRVPYKCFINATSINDRTARLLEESGCKQAQMGVQSLNPKVSAMLHRIPSNDEIENALDCLARTSMTVCADNMFGLPGEDPGDYLRLAEYYLKHHVDYIYVFWIIYFPRTELVEQAIRFKLFDEETAHKMELNPYRGDINRRTSLQPKSLIKMKILFDCFNYLPKPITEFIIRHRIYRFFPQFNFFQLWRMAHVFKHVREGDFPEPKTGNELIWLRHRRLIRYWIPKVFWESAS